VGSTDLDARSDLYSLGCVFYELLAGGPPFTATTPRGIVAKHMVEEPPSLATIDADIPGAVATVVERVLAKEPEDRFQTAAEFGAALEGAALTGTVGVHGSGAWLVDELVRTKTLHVMAAYVALGVIGVALAKWATNQFVLSPHLPTFVAVALASLLPAVGILAHYRGGRRRSGWSLGRTIGISANVVAALAILFLLFGSKDLGAATVTVAVEDEDGTVAERVVPKAAYRRKIAMFRFDNASGDTELDWMQLGVPFAVGIDLLQDPFLSVSDPVDLSDALTEAGEPEGLGLPLALKRRITAERHLGHFVGGEISRVGDSVRIVVDLHDTDRGRLLQRRTYDGSNVFELVDSISVQLRRDLGIPAGALDLTTDLPSSELFSESPTAYRAFAEGLGFFTQADFQSARSRRSIGLRRGTKPSLRPWSTATGSPSAFSSWRESSTTGWSSRMLIEHWPWRPCGRSCIRRKSRVTPNVPRCSC
jgi:TolB-like protein